MRKIELHVTYRDGQKIVRAEFVEYLGGQNNRRWVADSAIVTDSSPLASWLFEWVENEKIPTAAKLST